MSALAAQPKTWGEDVWIADGTRRRAAMAFVMNKEKLYLGFNAGRSSEIIDLPSCPLLTSGLNNALPFVRCLLEELCREPFTHRLKGRKVEKSQLQKGDILLCEADNGIDIVLEFPEEPELNHRLMISEALGKETSVIRISHRKKSDSLPETIVEKTPPVIRIGNIDVFIPAGSFLQAAKASETALINLVLKYLGTTEGRIADLFCGIGTFSYPLARNPDNKILAVDSSERLLEGFRRTVNKNMISNIEIKTKNLFKYPLDENELKGFNAVVFDPPRAGAAAQTTRLAALPDGERPEKIIAVSCKSIVMGRQSCLGPFDPQINNMPTQSVVSEFYKAVNDIANNPASLGLWQTIISKLTPTFLTTCEQANELSEELTNNILAKSGYDEDTKKRIKETFGKSQNSKTHSRHINRDKCREAGLAIEDLEANQDIQDAVLSIHHCCMILSEQTPIMKIVENNIGGAYVVQQPQIQVPNILPMQHK